MGVHYGNRPTGNAPASKLLNDYGGAAAAYSLRLLDLNNATNPVVRARRASDNTEKDFTSNEVDRGEVEKWTQEPPFVTNYDSSRDVGYFGEVSSSDLISGDDLATELNLTAGTSQNSDAGWLKFYVGPNAFCNRQGNAYILYVAKRSMRYSLSWNDINSAGGVDGTTEVGINGQPYRVRLMQGADADPATYNRGTTCADNPGENSEWNELFYRVSEKIPDCANPTEGMEGGSSTTRHGGPQNGSNWANFTNSELNVREGFGEFCACQEIIGDRRVTRGHLGIASYNTDPPTSGFQGNGWRPVLQLDLGQSTGDVSAFVTTWYDQSGNGNHATQTTATEQPKIVDSGTLVTENGKAAVDFDTSFPNNVRLNIDSPLSTNQYRDFAIMVAKPNSAQLGSIFNNNKITRMVGTIRTTTQSTQFSILWNGAKPFNPVTQLETNQNIITHTINFDNSNTIFVNGQEFNSETSENSPLTNGTSSRIGGTTSSIASKRKIDMLISEIIFYPSDQSANRIAIESNINSYYNIY